MKLAKYFVLPMLFVSSAAQAASASGDGGAAIILATIVSENSPTVTVQNKALLAKYANGHAGAPHPAGTVITIVADSVTCRASNVDVTTHSCEIKFGATTRALSGRKAHEVYATLIELGVPSEGAAGSIYEALTQLNCVLKTDEIADCAGSGAKCTFNTSQ